MNTTNMYVEQVIIGMLVLVAILMFIMPIHFSDQLVMFDWSRDNSFGLIDVTLIVIAAYLLGMVYDRVADTILEETDRHHRLRFALKDVAKKTRNGSVPEIKKDPFNEAKLRIRAMRNSEAADYMEYLRSRMRLLRALCTLVPFYTVAATLYLVTDWGSPGSNRRLWIAAGVAMLIVYGVVSALNVVDRLRKWRPPPKTSDLVEVNRYAKSHVEKGVPVWRWKDCCRDPGWHGFAIGIAMSGGILARAGDLRCDWPVPVAGFLLTLLIGWAWLRVSKTFMLFIVSFDHYTKK